LNSKFAFLILVFSSLAHAEVKLEAVNTTKAGSELVVAISGTDHPRDFVTIMPKGAPEGVFDTYQYAGSGGGVKLRAPAKAGEYEIRVLAAAPPYKTLARRSVVVEVTSAAISSAPEVSAGKRFSFTWSGPDNIGDYIGIGEIDPKGERYLTFAYTKSGVSLTLTAPDKPGVYELRYFLASGSVIATQKITVTGVTATLQGPANVGAGEIFKVAWTGPNNMGDYITIVGGGTQEGSAGNFSYTATGSPAVLVAPPTPGGYEIRYSTGQSHLTLARTAISVAPGKEEAGLISVSASRDRRSDRAVEVILDASGSMLLRVGKQTRIDIAKQTLLLLTSSLLAPGTPFALRVLGRELDSCQTTLDIPLGPLNPEAVSTRLSALQVKNRARTPIGASIARIGEDLSAAKGERLIVLLTDGEETCGGDAAAEVQKLKTTGVPFQLNIVGFAIDNKKIGASFRHLAELGNGSYFDAKDAASLTKSIGEAMQPGFEVFNPSGTFITSGFIGGPPVRVVPGAYSIRLRGQPSIPPIHTTVKPRQTSQVAF
jgi:hypothetical protein